MPAVIDHYILTRRNEHFVEVEIFDTTSYASRQLYVDNALSVETTETTFIAAIKKNQKVDILGLSGGEVGQDLSHHLSDDNGDKVEFDLPTIYEGKQVRVYGDNRTGFVDFGKPLGDATASNVIDDGLNLGDLTLEALGDLTLHGLGSLELDGHAEPYVKLFITRRLPDGAYKFALVNWNAADNYHAPQIISKLIATRPDEAEPYLVAYDPDTDLLTLSAGVEETDGYTYWVYAADWGEGKDLIDFDSPLIGLTSSPLHLPGLRGSQLNGTRYLAVRKAKGVIEEKNFNIVAFVVANGDWVGNVPGAPFKLKGTILAENKVRLRWQYQIDGAVPTGFKVYSGTTSINYASPIADVPFENGILGVELPSISATTKFAVRAYKGGNEEQNIEYITVTPLSVPELVEGEAFATWKDS